MHKKSILHVLCRYHYEFGYLRATVKQISRSVDEYNIILHWVLIDGILNISLFDYHISVVH